MRLLAALVPLLPLASASALGVPSDSHLENKRKIAPEPPATYAPQQFPCPRGSLIRSATGGVSSSERAYVTARKKKADKALKSWLATAPGAVTFTAPPDGLYPTLAMTTSGGGFRSMLTSAGVHMAFDSRDSSLSTSGLYQALTYEAGLSGGAWLLGSLAANNWPTVSSLSKAIWQNLNQSFVDTFIWDTYFYDDVHDDVDAKSYAGFPISVIDLYGRLLSNNLLNGPDGGLASTMSGIAYLSNFLAHSVPYPIITALGTPAWDGDCTGGLSATQYEFTPFEFGSWDTGVAAFTPTKYLGSILANGRPVNSSACYIDYDNTGFVMGTSSAALVSACGGLPGWVTLFIDNFISTFLPDGDPLTSLLALLPNPFYKSSKSPSVSTHPELYLTDGALDGQDIPIWPFLRRGVADNPSPKHAWNIDVLIVSDNGGDANNYPDGSALYATYTYAASLALPGMPLIPTNDIFLAEGLNTRPVLFGCDDPTSLTIIYLPNTNLSYPSNTDLFQFAYPPAALNGMIYNGVEVATHGLNATWGLCLRCAVMAKSSATLPDACAACLDEYCYVPAPVVGPAACADGPGTCNAFPSCNADQNCYCGEDTEGELICWQDFWCDQLVPCAESADCGAGERCLVASNCCAQTACVVVDVCGNALAPSRIFGNGKGVGKSGAKAG